MKNEELTIAITTLAAKIDDTKAVVENAKASSDAKDAAHTAVLTGLQAQVAALSTGDVDPAIVDALTQANTNIDSINATAQSLVQTI